VAGSGGVVVAANCGVVVVVVASSGGGRRGVEHVFFLFFQKCLPSEVERLTARKINLGF
jgi:hypothetical protein